VQNGAFGAKQLPHDNTAVAADDGDEWTKAQYLQDRKTERQERFYAKAPLKLLTRHASRGWGGQSELERRKKEKRGRIAGQVVKHLSNVWPYRRATSRWAGGEHKVSVSIVPSSQVAASGDSWTVWSRNGKWSGTNSSAELRISERAVRTLGVEGLVIGGLITLDVKKLGHREYQAVWATQSLGVTLKVERGYIIRGYHVAASSLERARRIVARKRSAAVALRMAMRAGVDTVALAEVRVTRSDSLRGGNCTDGTDAFIAKHNIAPKTSVPAYELLALDDSYYTRRAVAAAVARKKAAQEKQMAHA
jgi:hypothetical protein